MTQAATEPIQRISRQVAPFPPIVYIEPTNACNAGCSICPRCRMTRPVGYMSAELFGRLLRQIAAHGRSEIRLFNFGEPLLHPGLVSMLSACRAAGFAARFQTNGIALTERASTELLRAGLDYLGVSVNALTADEYSLIRRGCDMNRVRDNVARFRQLSLESRRPVHIHINAQILKNEQQRRKDDIRTFAAYWGGIADSMSVSGLSLFHGIRYVSNGSLQECDQRLLTPKPLEEVGCEEPFDRLIVKWDGRVTPCCADYDAELVVGDANREELVDIWTSPRLQAVRETVARKDFESIPLCRTCPKLYSDNFTLLFKKPGQA